jgi:hypothetical protein
MGTGSECQSVDRVDAVDLILIESDLSKVDSEILFKKDDNFYRIDRLQTATKQEGILVRQRLCVAILQEQVMDKLMNVGSSFHVLSLKTDEKQAHKVLHVFCERITALNGHENV